MRSSAAPGYGFRYRRWVLDSLRYVDVRDLATGGEHIPELGDVYIDVALVSRISQQASAPPPDSAGENTAAGNTAAETTAAANPTAAETAERHSIGELLGRRSRVVLALVGQPGSGKSTLLAQAARRSAQWSVRGRLGRKRVPVLLRLREIAEWVVANPAISLPAVARAAAGGRAGKEPRGWWERQFRRGRCLVLLDGLDEVARPADRLAVADWVERQIASYAGNDFVVASRPYGLPASLAAQADVYVVRPFSAEQVQLFLDRWYLAAERHATGAAGRTAQRAARVRAQESAGRLAILLREHPALQDLAVSPLLLTMIATAHRYRGALPASRGDLYGEICRVLLSRRVQDGEQPELLSWPAKQALLAALAYQMMRDHAANLPAGRILEILGPLLERFGAPVTGAAFLEDIARSGLLVEAPAGRYAFTHLTFQEYLAARHVSASPDLVKSLADNVDDPWWHETILLYAATADASPIVRACLESGTITALTLAFDCNEASTEIDPDLRRHLDRERRRAYEPDCSPEHRRLIAGVQAARLVRRTFTTAAGTRVCVRPVPADLYWLFLADTQAPRPDSPCDPDSDQPATGMWGTEAQAFVTWLNSITATATGIEVRLPRRDELQEETVADPLARLLPAAVTSAWTAPHLGLWLRPGQPDPHELPGSAIRQAVAADARNTALLTQVLTAAVLDVALRIIRDLADARALGRALDEDLAARANSGGRLVDLMHAHVHAIVRTYAHALDLTRADAVTRTCAADPELVRTLGLAPARALADAIAGSLTETIERARTQAVELADAIDLDLSVLSAFDFDVPHTVDLAQVHTADLDRAHVLARGILQDPELGLAPVIGLASVGSLDPSLPLPGILGLPLRWVADGPLASTLLQVLAANPAAPAPAGTPAGTAGPLPGDPYLAFALALSSRAGIAEGTQLRAALGSPLTDRLRDLTAAASRPNGRSADWSQATVLGRLTGACAPMCAAHQTPAPAEAAALRAVALALAGDPSGLPGTDAPAVLRTVAATVTVTENRGRGEATTGESVILALM
jgi:NACHT domain